MYNYVKDSFEFNLILHSVLSRTVKSYFIFPLCWNLPTEELQIPINLCQTKSDFSVTYFCSSKMPFLDPKIFITAHTPETKTLILLSATTAVLDTRILISRSSQF